MTEIALTPRYLQRRETISLLEAIQQDSEKLVARLAVCFHDYKVIGDTTTQQMLSTAAEHPFVHEKSRVSKGKHKTVISDTGRLFAKSIIENSRDEDLDTLLLLFHTSHENIEQEELQRLRRNFF